MARSLSELKALRDEESQKRWDEFNRRTYARADRRREKNMQKAQLGALGAQQLAAEQDAEAASMRNRYARPVMEREAMLGAEMADSQLVNEQRRRRVGDRVFEAMEPPTGPKTASDVVGEFISGVTGIRSPNRPILGDPAFINQQAQQFAPQAVEGAMRPLIGEAEDPRLQQTRMVNDRVLQQEQMRAERERENAERKQVHSLALAETELANKMQFEQTRQQFDMEIQQMRQQADMTAQQMRQQGIAESVILQQMTDLDAQIFGAAARRRDALEAEAMAALSEGESAYRRFLQEKGPALKAAEDQVADLEGAAREAFSAASQNLRGVSSPLLGAPAQQQPQQNEAMAQAQTAAIAQVAQIANVPFYYAEMALTEDPQATPAEIAASFIEDGRPADPRGGLLGNVNPR